MPPPGRLPQGEIDTLARWIKRPANEIAGSRAAAAASPRRASQDEAKNYWAWASETPGTCGSHTSWSGPIVHSFLRGSKKEAQAGHARGQDTLVRRVYYDLIGLPPTRTVDEFVDDKSDGLEAYRQPAGSRRTTAKNGPAQTDLVRYAETNGYGATGKPFAWRFRDYVVKSFNDDKPFDRFIREQLAGDEIDRDNIEAIVATGFYRLGIWDDEPADPKQSRFDEFDDWVATTGQVFLGMTMNCARCHDHKIDPIPQADYYRLLAFFQDVQHFSDNRDVKSSFNISDISPPEVRKTYGQELKKREARKAES